LTDFVCLGVSMIAPEIHFVISAPRSGSTWLARALNHHPAIFATEQRLFGNFCEMWPNNNGKLAPRITLDAYARAVSVHYFRDAWTESREQFIDQFIREYCRFLLHFASSRTGKSIIVDKITPYPGTMHCVLEQIDKYFPDAKRIKLVRDGRDVLTSGTFDWLLKDGQGTERFKCFVEQDSSIELQRFFDDVSIRKWAENWRETVRELQRYDLEIRFEGMQQNQPAVLSDIFELLEVSADEKRAAACAGAVTFEKITGRKQGQMEPTAKQRRGICGDWKRYFTRRDGELFHEIAGAELLSTGYVDTNDWFRECPEQLAVRFGTDAQGAT